MNDKGCSFLECGINFNCDNVTDCCITHNDGRGMPVLIENYHGEKIDWNKLFDTKEMRIKAQQFKTIYECENCYHLNNYRFQGIRKISEFHFSHCRLCNAKCVYCDKEYNDGDLNFDTYEIIKNLYDEGFYAPGGEATLQGGEPTIMKSFDKLVAFFVEHGTVIRVHSNAIRYSENIANALSLNKGNIVVSLDCGCKETYKTIKRVDFFDAVCENIKKYVEASSDNVILKYIIVPGYNDNLDEIDLFFKTVKALGVKTVALDIDNKYAQKHENKYVSPHIFLLVDYFKKKTDENKINLLIYSFISYVLKNRKTLKFPFMCNRKLFEFWLKLKTDKSKNIRYKEL